MLKAVCTESIPLPHIIERNRQHDWSFSDSALLSWSVFQHELIGSCIHYPEYELNCPDICYYLKIRLQLVLYIQEKKMLLLCISLQNPLPTSRRDSNSSGIKPTKLVRFMFNSYNADNLAVCCFSICKFLKLTTAIAFCIPLNRDTWVLPFLLHFRSACLTKVLILLHMVENRLINIMKAATVH